MRRFVGNGMSLLKTFFVIMVVNFDFLLDWSTIRQVRRHGRIKYQIFLFSVFDLENKKVMTFWNSIDKDLIKDNKCVCIKIDLWIMGIAVIKDRILKFWPKGYFCHFREIKDLDEIIDFGWIIWLFLSNGIGDMRGFMKVFRCDWVSKVRNCWGQFCWVPVSPADKSLDLAFFFFFFSLGCYENQQWWGFFFGCIEMHGMGQLDHFFDLEDWPYEWQLKIVVEIGWFGIFSVDSEDICRPAEEDASKVTLFAIMHKLKVEALHHVLEVCAYTDSCF